MIIDSHLPHKKKTMNDHLKSHIEALIFATDQPITLDEIQNTLCKTGDVSISLFEVETHLNALIKKYEAPDFAFQIVHLEGGYQFFTKNDYAATVAEMLKDKMNKRLSTNQMEVLSIVAYKQPISKPEIESIRGVNCDYSVQKLLEKDLIVISGKAKQVGSPILYSVSTYFMNYFGINSPNDLPKLKDIEQPETNTIGVLSEN